VRAPDNVQQNVLKIGIAIVAMVMPAIGLQVDFHIAGFWRFTADLQKSAAKIRAGFVIPKTGVKNAHRSAVQRAELIAKEALMKPDDLQQALGQRRMGFAEENGFSTLQTPLRVEAGFIRGHRNCFSSRAFAKSSTDVTPAGA